MKELLSFYNEIEPFAADWLERLIANGLIAPGIVDRRDIRDIKPSDLDGFIQCHFFAGIGGWSHALRLSGWPDDKPVWTASCPCQPLSSAGQHKGHADERHLWPAFYSPLAECCPSVVFGEQVASKDGREWLAGIRADLEILGYACGGADLCAAGVGAPHPRQRIYWMADANGGNAGAQRQQCSGKHGQFAEDNRSSKRMAVTSSERSQGAEPQERLIGIGPFSSGSRGIDRLGNPSGAGLQGQWSEYCPSGERHRGLSGLAMQNGVPEWNGPTVAVRCSDGSRRISAQPNSFPLAHGVSGRMGRLRGVGNSIVPQVAAEFIRACEEALEDQQKSRL